MSNTTDSKNPTIEMTKTFYRVIPESRSFSSTTFKTLKEAKTFIEAEGKWEPKGSSYYSPMEIENYKKYWKTYGAGLTIEKVTETTEKI